MTKLDISEWDVSSSRKRKLPSKFSDSVITCTLGKTASVKSGLAVEDAEFTVFIQHFNRKMQTEKQRYPTCGSARQLPYGHFF